jgi:malonate transporter and related proteins
MSTFWFFLVRSAPLFGTVLVGYALARSRVWPQRFTAPVSKFVFLVPLPALLFNMMSDLSALPPVDMRLLGAFFGGCIVVFVLGRLASAYIFHLDGVAQSVFALGGIFSNNVLLGLPLAKVTLGPASLPCVALVLVFNALTLWTLATVSVEWARHGAFSLAGFGRMAFSVLTNPIVAAILSGTLFGLLGFHLPAVLRSVLHTVGQTAGPLALLVLGMGLAGYSVRQGLNESLTICALKLVVLPLVVWGLALVLHLPLLERQVVVLLSSMSVGANVYLMSVQFNSLQGTVATSLVLSTALAALTTPFVLAALS